MTFAIGILNQIMLIMLMFNNVKEIEHLVFFGDASRKTLLESSLE